jgi:hypothetical protein
MDGFSLGHSKPLRRKSSLHSLKEALLQTKDALLAAIGMLPQKHAEGVDDSWPYRLLEKHELDLYIRFTNIIPLDPTCPQLQPQATAMSATHQNPSFLSSMK